MAAIVFDGRCVAEFAVVGAAARVAGLGPVVGVVAKGALAGIVLRWHAVAAFAFIAVVVDKLSPLVRGVAQ